MTDPQIPEEREAGQPQHATDTAAARHDTAPGGDRPHHQQAASPTAGSASPMPRGKAADSVAWSLRVSAEWSWRILLVGVLVYFLLRAYGAIHLVAFSFIVGLLIGAVLRPVHNFLENRAHFPSALAALASVLLAIAVLGGVGFFVFDQISSNTGELGNQLTKSVTGIRDWLENGPFHVQESDLNSISDRITSAIQTNQSAIASGVFDTAKTAIEGLSGLLLVILTTFFVVKDGPAMWRWVVSLLPHAARGKVDEAGHRSWHTLGGYVRGQVVIALFHSITITIALFAFQVPLAAPLGVLVFLGSFIPIIGLIIAGGLAVLITLLEHGVLTAVIILVIVVALVQLESHVLQPLIMSRAVSIHPLAVALAVIAGTKLDGISGALLAVPLVAVANTAFKALHGVESDDTPVRIPRPRVRRPKSRNTEHIQPPPSE